MSLLKPLATDAGTTADNLERAVRAAARLGDEQERVAAAVEKASRAPAPLPGGGLLNAAGQPLSVVSGGGASLSRSTGGGGGAGSSRVILGTGRLPLWLPGLSESTIPMEEWDAEDWAAFYGRGVGSNARRKSGRGTGGGGSGGGGGGRITHMDQLGNYNTAAVRAGATPVAINAGPGNKLSADGVAVVTAVNNLSDQIRELRRSDNGAQLRRRGEL